MMILDLYLIGAIAMLIVAMIWDLDSEDTFYLSVLWFIVLPLGMYYKITDRKKK